MGSFKPDHDAGHQAHDHSQEYARALHAKYRVSTHVKPLHAHLCHGRCKQEQLQQVQRVEQTGTGRCSMFLNRPEVLCHICAVKSCQYTG